MPAKTAFILLVVFFISSSFSNGQENYYSKNFTTENGIPHNHVYSIAQDSTGFLWVATWDGLSRYDGYEFCNYYHNPIDTNSISFFWVRKVLVDYQNNVWVYCSSGISEYNRATDNFTRVLSGDIVDATVDREGKIWANSTAGLCRWDYETGQFEKVTVVLDSEMGKIVSNNKFYFRFDNDNRMWVTVSDVNSKLHYSRCNKFENNGLQSEYIGSIENLKYIPLDNYDYFDFEILVSGDSCVWQLVNTGIFKLDKKHKKFVPLPKFNVETDFSGLTENDIQRAKEKLKFYKPLGKVDEISSKTELQFVETYLVDRQKTVWQSVISEVSQANGLTRNIPVGKGFKHYFFEENPKTGLNPIFPVLKDRFGTIWAGPTNINKIFRIDKNGKTNTVVPIDNETWRVAQQPRAFIDDSAGIWIGYRFGLLLHYDFKSNRFVKELFKTNALNDRDEFLNVFHLKSEGDDIYIIGYRDIYKYHIKTKEFEPMNLFEFETNYSIQSAFRDEKNWWIGTGNSRIIHYDNQFKEIAPYTFGSGMFNVEDIIQGDNNDLWITLLGGGLVNFDKTIAKYRIYTTADGLSNNTCYGLLKDKRGNIWISTDHGISRFNPKTGKFRIFGPEDGLKIDEFNSGNTYLAPDGEMFFAGMGGVVSFYPDSVDIETGSQFTAPLLITDFRVSGATRYFKKAIYETDSVTMNKGENNFKVTFACLDFVNAQKIKYRYRLGGVNEEFTETDYRNRTVNFANLTPGSYHLDIEATNANGDWVSKTALFIRIPPYYYQTWWFRVLAAFIVVGLAGYFIYMNIRQIRLKARQQQDELKLESLRGQMNPHFIFNSLNSINYFISQNDRLSANRYIADFSRLIRSILGNLSQEFISLSKELESLNDYLKLEHLRFSDKFDYEILVDEKVNTEDVLVFPGMVQPFIENAIWHGVRGLEGRKGFVKIRLMQDKPDCIIAVVEDDGIGRKLAESRKSSLPGKTSRGIGIVFERLKIINHLHQTNFQVTIEDFYSDREEAGTRVTVEIPVKEIANS